MLDDGSEAQPLYLQATLRGPTARLTATLSFLNGFGERSPPTEPPALLLQSLIVAGPRTPEGAIVEAVTLPWHHILGLIAANEETIHQIDWRKWEEIIAGAYKQEGYDVVITARSNDGGRDIIATKVDVGSIRILDQVKAYSPGHLVNADEVRAMMGVLSLEGNVSKGFVTTTSDFAPGIMKDPRLAGFMPHRLELRNRSKLLQWLADLALRGASEPKAV